MRNYLRLLRLQDQFVQFGSALFGGIFVGDRSWDILLWAVAVTLLSCATFIVNEVVDRRDSDRYSWNPVHRHHQDVLDPLIVWTLFFVTSVGGLWLAAGIGFFWFALAIWVIGVLYSIEPIRFKRRFGLDIVAQLLAWWIVPFLAPVWGVAPWELTLSMVVIMSCINWSLFYPYQIADFKADKKAGLRNTHVVLGVYTSAQVGCILGVVGLILFFLFGFQRYVWTLLPILVIQIAAFLAYATWLRDRKVDHILAGMQRYARIVKAIGLATPVYLFLCWRLFDLNPLF